MKVATVKAVFLVHDGATPGMTESVIRNILLEHGFDPSSVTFVSFSDMMTKEEFVQALFRKSMEDM